MGLFGGNRKNFKFFSEYIVEVSGNEIKSRFKDVEKFDRLLDGVGKKQSDEFEEAWKSGEQIVEYTRTHSRLNRYQIEDIKKAMKVDRGIYR